jgi:prephenate dehydrogenase
MQLHIEGNGAFGSFLREILTPHFEMTESAQSVILAVPISAYVEVGEKFKDRHLVNVCSVQSPSTATLLKLTDQVTSIHPLFGRRTPSDKRNSILTHSCIADNDTWSSGGPEAAFLEGFGKVSSIFSKWDNRQFTPELHDQLMAKTHRNALLAARQAKVFVELAQDVPDFLIPNSFRLLRDFVKTLDDMPKGTVESILANPY